MYVYDNVRMLSITVCKSAYLRIRKYNSFLKNKKKGFLDINHMVIKYFLMFITI